jgi:hypothetical protein
MKRRVLLVVAAYLVVATIAPTATQAGDAFWHGVNIDDCGMDPTDMENIHEAIWDAIIGMVPTPTGFPTGDPINDKHRGLRIYKPRKCWNGYTLLNAFASVKDGGNNVLIDMKGNVINSWRFGMGFMSAAKMLPGGHVVGAQSTNPFSFHGNLTQLDWNGNVVHSWPESAVHHDHEREGNPCGYFAPYQKPRTFCGKVLVLEMHYPTADGYDTSHICGAKDKDGNLVGITDDRIRVLTWDNKELFRWDCWKYFDKLGLDEWAEAGLDLHLNFMGFDPNEDWSHGNAVAWVGPNKWWSQHYDGRFHPCNIIADFRSLNITIIIARFPHPYGKWKAGDIVWKLGPDYSTAGEDFKVGQIIGQHQAHMIPMYLPGAGNMLIFDNGGAAGYGAFVQGLRDEAGNPLGAWPNTYRFFSRVLEINPITKQIVWEYKQPNLSKDKNGDGKILGNEKLFFSNLMSGMQRLMNGNTLICEADVGRIFEVTKCGEVVWEYAPTWVPPGTSFFSAVYRAYRIPYWWIPRHLVCKKKGP